jgi:hypothetical protein
MGKTYQKNSRRFDDDVPSGRSGNHSKHTNGKKTGGMRTLNSYVEDYNEDSFDLEDDLMYNDTSTDTKNKP